MLKWIGSYLSNRKQCATANNIVSPYYDIVCGVHQGSILGPLFCIIYVNDIKASMQITQLFTLLVTLI